MSGVREMGVFILGVLIGWLAEWLFFTFWVKSRSNGDSDCSGLRAELDAKNKELSALKAVSSAASTATTKSVTKAPVKKAAVTKKPASAKKAVATKKAVTTKKTVAKKAVPKKAVTAKNTAATPSPRKIAVKKAPEAKKAAPKKVANKASGDDLTKLSGIGPSMAKTLGELGITSYKKLAAMDDDILRDMLEASGARLNNNKEAMDSWNEQATLADKGDFAGLKKLQDELNG